MWEAKQWCPPQRRRTQSHSHVPRRWPAPCTAVVFSCSDGIYIVLRRSGSPRAGRYRTGLLVNTPEGALCGHTAFPRGSHQPTACSLRRGPGPACCLRSGGSKSDCLSPPAAGRKPVLSTECSPCSQGAPAQEPNLDSPSRQVPRFSPAWEESQLQRRVWNARAHTSH